MTDKQDGTCLIERWIYSQPTIDIEERLEDAYAHGWTDAEAKFHDAVKKTEMKWLEREGEF